MRYGHALETPPTPRTRAPAWAGIVTIVPGLRGERPVIRGMRITIGDVIEWLASGMSEAVILEDFPELSEADIRAALAFAAERERSTRVADEHGASMEEEERISPLASVVASEAVRSR